MSKKKPVDLALPADYQLVIEDGKAVIARDFFPDLSASNFDDDWAAVTIKFRPYFWLHTLLLETSTVNSNHCTALSTVPNRKAWLFEAQNDIMGKIFREWRMR